MHQLLMLPLETAPSGTAYVELSRWTVDPGARQSIGSQLGPIMFVLESGSLALPSDDADAEMKPGDVATVIAGQSMAVQNNGSEPAVELVVAVTPEKPAWPAETGVTQMTLAGGMVELPTEPARVSLSRLTLAPETITLAQSIAGPEFLAVEKGDLSLALHPGEMTITRAAGDQESVIAGNHNPLATPEISEEEEHEEGHHAAASPEAERTELNGTVAGLTAGDSALVASGGTYTLQGGDDGSALLVLTIAPAGA
jgi:quercetin dioxygenase-like cupin family protein